MLPAEAYTSEAVLAWERRHLFAEGWVCAGRSADLADAGDRRAVRVGDDSVVLVRGDDGVLRGFSNVCRHRGHELLPVRRPRSGATPSTARTTPGPTPSTARSRSTPRFDAPEGFDPTQFTAWSRSRIEEWRGWVVRQRRRATPARWPSTSAASTTAIAPLRARAPGGRRRRHCYELAANWKLPVENYHECYHCPPIHPELCVVSPPDSGDNCDDHDGMWVGGWMELADDAETMSLDGRSRRA